MTAPRPHPASPGVTREAFLAAIRDATHRGQAPTAAPTAPTAAPTAPTATPAPPTTPDFARLTRATDPLRELFITRATAAGIQLAVAQDWRTTLRAELARRFPGRTLRITLAITGDELRRAVQAELAALGHAVLHASGAAHQFHADIGITDIYAALAETGSIVLASSSAAPRATALVPPLHIAIAFERQILPDLLDLFPPAATPQPTTLTIISGPSKTADIEGILVTGVHGPSELLVILE